VEIGVASTKAFMNQLGALACLAIVAGRQRGHLTPEREAELVKTLLACPR
jgi:glucosamine--fructose-6-phosphate aminotransferase (isomerizing)